MTRTEAIAIFHAAIYEAREAYKITNDLVAYHAASASAQSDFNTNVREAEKAP